MFGVTEMEAAGRPRRRQSTIDGCYGGPGSLDARLSAWMRTGVGATDPVSSTRSSPGGLIGSWCWKRPIRRSPTPPVQRPPSGADAGEWIAVGVFTALEQAALEALRQDRRSGPAGTCALTAASSRPPAGPGRRPLTGRPWQAGHQAFGHGPGGARHLHRSGGRPRQPP